MGFPWRAISAFTFFTKSRLCSIDSQQRYSVERTTRRRISGSARCTTAVKLKAATYRHMEYNFTIRRRKNVAPCTTYGTASAHNYWFLELSILSHRRDTIRRKRAWVMDKTAYTSLLIFLFCKSLIATSVNIAPMLQCNMYTMVNDVYWGVMDSTLRRWLKIWSSTI